MPTRAEMHNLAQGIIGDFEARTDGIAYLRREVGEHRQAMQTQLHELNQAHQSMSGQLRSDLKRGCASFSKAEARRKAKVHSWIGRVAAERAAGQKEWHMLAATMAAKRTGA